MLMNEMFPSAYFRAEDFTSGPRTLYITSIAMEQFDDKSKPIISFQGETKKLVLNKTNAGMVASMHGNDSTGWIGKPITLREDRVAMGSEIKPCIRVNYIPANTEVAPAATESDEFV